MTPLLRVARLFGTAAPGRARTGPRLGAAIAVLLVGLSFGIGRLAFAGLIDGRSPLSGGGGSVRLVVSEFGLTQDTIWAVSAQDPDRPGPVAVVPHAPGAGTYASPS